MNKLTNKILVSSFLFLSMAGIVSLASINLNSIVNKNQKSIKKEFTSIDSNYFRWPLEGESVQAEVNGVMSTIYTPVESDYETFTNYNGTRMLGFRSGVLKKWTKTKNFYINVLLPSTVTEVAEGAFSSVKELMTYEHQKNADNYIDVNNKILRMDFSRTTNLTGLNHNAFNGLQKLYEVYFKNDVKYHVTQLGNGIFKDCISLKRVLNYDNVTATYIQNDMFKNSGLEYIKFSPHLGTIGIYAFAGTKLKTADLSNTRIHAIKEGAFYNSDIKAAYIPDNVIIRGNVFYSDKNHLDAYKINMQAKNYTTENLKFIGLKPASMSSKKAIKVYFNKNKFKNDFRYGPTWTRNDFNALSMSEKAKYFILAGPEQKTLPGEAYFRTLSINEAGNFDMSFASNYDVTYINKMPPQETIFQRHNQTTTEILVQEKDSAKIEAQLRKEIDLWNSNHASRNDPTNFMIMKYGFSFRIENVPNSARLQLLSFEKTSSNNFKASLKLTNAIVNSEPNKALIAHSEIKTIPNMQFTSSLRDRTLKGGEYTEEKVQMINDKLNMEIDWFNKKISSNQIDPNNPFVNFEILNSLKLNISNFNSNIRLKRVDNNILKPSTLNFQIQALNGTTSYIPDLTAQSLGSLEFTIKFDEIIPESPSSNKNLVIAGSTMGTILAATLLIAAIFFIFKKKKMKK